MEPRLLATFLQSQLHGPGLGALHCLSKLRKSRLAFLHRPPHPGAWAYPGSLAPSGNSLPRWEDESTAGRTGKVTQSGRGALRASLPRSADCLGPAGVWAGVGRLRCPWSHACPQCSGPRVARGLGVGDRAHFSGTRRPRGCRAGSQGRRPLELDDGVLKDFHQIWAVAGNVQCRAPPETSSPGHRWGPRARGARGRVRGSRADPGPPPRALPPRGPLLSVAAGISGRQEPYPAFAPQFPRPSTVTADFLPAITPRRDAGGRGIEGKKRGGVGALP
jgi:hypothetical protein